LLCFDEWNVWYRTQNDESVNGHGKVAQHLVEEQYNLEDALLVGGFVNTLLRRSDRVRLGCIAQIVNVIAPLMTNAEKTIRQTIYYPYAWALQYAHGRVLDLHVESETYPIRAEGLRADFAREEQVPFLDVVATHNPQNGQVALFMLNRDTTAERELTVSWQSPTPSRVLVCQTLTGRDLKAINTFDQPNNVVPRTLDAPQVGSSMTFRLPAGSYTVAHLT
jgi:alpha-N-arabinofuranosidase